MFCQILTKKELILGMKKLKAKYKLYLPISVVSAFFGLLTNSAQAQIDPTPIESAFTLSSSSGIWTGTTGGGDTVTGIGTNEVRWGISAGTSVENKSGLRFDGVGSTNFDIDEIFAVGTLTHFNNPIPLGTDASAANLQVTLDFSTPTLDEAFNFSFGVDETPNPAPDVITFPSALPSESFSFEGQDYTLELIGFGDRSTNLDDEFISPENGSNTTQLFAQITEVEVSPPSTPPSTPTPPSTRTTPEPLGLAGLGLVSFYLISRRSNNRKINR
jgi:hypothetical protein